VLLDRFLLVRGDDACELRCGEFELAALGELIRANALKPAVDEFVVFHVVLRSD